MDNFWYKDTLLPPLPPPTVRVLLDLRLRCENGRTALSLSISNIQKLASRQQHFGDEIRAADEAHASSRLPSTSSTPSSTSSTRHGRPAPRRRRCSCTDCRELLLHQLHFVFQLQRVRDSLPSLPRVPPRLQLGTFTTSTPTPRRHASASFECSRRQLENHSSEGLEIRRVSSSFTLLHIGSTRFTLVYQFLLNCIDSYLILFLLYVLLECT